MRMLTEDGVNYGYHACRRRIAYDEKTFIKTV